MREEVYESNRGLRAIATIIDYIIIWSFFIIYIYEFGELQEDGSYSASGLKGLAPFIFWFLYLPISEWKFKTTLGHWTVGLEIISENQDELTLWRTIKRRIVDPIDIHWCFGLLAFIIVTSTDKKQRLGDILAKTLVVKKK
ncbi:RDD family protein [Flavobacteriaceae bacterium R38]|nr:RDD family protein [Flavobacteriaceae bacterium R38]